MEPITIATIALGLSIASLILTLIMLHWELKDRKEENRVIKVSNNLSKIDPLEGVKESAEGLMGSFREIRK